MSYSRTIIPGLIMALAYRLALLSFAIMLCLTGCCTKPLICPNGACGPIAFGSACQGCDHCDGCGELYIDPWINHPAGPCDPCHECQGYNPHSCGNSRAVFSGFPSLWGYRSTPWGVMVVMVVIHVMEVVTPVIQVQLSLMTLSPWKFWREMVRRCG